MITKTASKRPRNVDWTRAAAMLYGDWGTSKAYVIGLAFLAGGYASFWLIASMCLLTAIVGVNYMAICRCYPDGGGVYASVRHRSEVLSIVGAFLLIADYIVTAAISALSAFQYLGLPHPELFAGAAIAGIGALNYLGPKHTGGLAFAVSVPVVMVVVGLTGFSIPHFGEALQHLQPLGGGFLKNWQGFVGIVLALSGVEAIANSTGVMKLDPGSTDEKPLVTKTANKALLWVMAEVCFFTAVLGFAMHALPGLVTTAAGDVNAPGAVGVRDYMLRYMGEVFVGGALGPGAGLVAGWIISIVFGVLLLSAVNTAIGALIAMSFLMSRDGEVPLVFQKLNRFGVPNAGIVCATIVPVGLVLLVSDVSGLADLYAVGVVGAIATNLAASSTDKHLPLFRWERYLMLGTFVIMAAIELSLFWDKPNARLFSLAILATGLIARGLATENRQKREAAQAAASGSPVSNPGAAELARRIIASSAEHTTSGQPLLAAVRGIGRTLDFAIEEAKETDRPLYVLFVREQPIITSDDRRRKWGDDPEAVRIFAYTAEKVGGHTFLPCYAVSDSAADTIVDFAATIGASRLLVGAPQRNTLVSLLRGNMVRQVAESLPEDIHMLVYA